MQSLRLLLTAVDPTFAVCARMPKNGVTYTIQLLLLHILRRLHNREKIG